MIKQQPTPTSSIPPINEKEYDLIRKKVYDLSRINLGPGKMNLVSTRLMRRLKALNLKSYNEYCDLINSTQGDAELIHLIDAISTNHTYFFRENIHFDLLKDKILPETIPKLGFMEPFNVWIAACSSGEEAYSTSIVLNEALKSNPLLQWKINCTDISSDILHKAKKGVYPGHRLESVPKHIIANYFHECSSPDDGFYKVSPALQKGMSFHQQNLLKLPYPFSHKVHVIFCRNVMIYFDTETIEQLIGYLEDHLLPGGYLFIGHTENLNRIKHNLKLIQPATYQKPF